MSATAGSFLVQASPQAEDGRRGSQTSATTSQEVPLNWSRWIRLTHRWLSIAFTVAVIVNGVAVAQKRYTNRLGLLAVFTLALQYFTGLYLFALPYATKWRSGRRTE